MIPGELHVASVAGQGLRRSRWQPRTSSHPSSLSTEDVNRHFIWSAFKNCTLYSSAFLLPRALTQNYLFVMKTPFLCQECLTAWIPALRPCAWYFLYFDEVPRRDVLWVFVVQIYSPCSFASSILAMSDIVKVCENDNKDKTAGRGGGFTGEAQVIVA